MSKVLIEYRSRSGRHVSRQLTCQKTRVALRRLAKKSPSTRVCLGQGRIHRCSRASVMYRQLKNYGFGDCRRPGYYRR